MEEKEKKFIKKPDYPGGKEALTKFINSNLRYPEDAIKEKIEGVVTVAYEVNDEGLVVSSKVVKSLYPSCDEEALRIVGLLKYCSVHNRGVRVRANHKINIFFRINKTIKQLKETMQIQYSVVESKPDKSEKTENSDNKSSGETYNYTISW